MCAASHGSFLRTYLLSSHVSLLAVDAFFREKSLPASAQATKYREQYRIRDLSRLFCLLVDGDLSILHSGDTSTPKSLKELVRGVSDLAHEELFKSRVLSYDTLQLTTDLGDFFLDLCDEYGLRDSLAKYPTRGQALEDVVTTPLIGFLDCVQLDGSIRDNKDGFLKLKMVRSMGLPREKIAAYCRTAAGAVARRFIKNEFESKRFLKRNPALLGISASATGARASDLDMHLHHAAAGPARDKRMVEWMIQCGALYLQPTHCRNPPEPGTLDRGVVRKQLCNHLAVHSAAAAGLEDAVRLLLEADHLRDLNTRIFHTKESLAHLAVKNGHRGVYELLERLGADVRRPDAKGKYVYDHTSDASWKESIRALAEKQRRDYDSKGGRKYVRANVTLAKLLSKLGKQREDAKSASPSNGKPAQIAPPPEPTTTQSENSITKSAKKKKKKKGKKKQAGTQDKTDEARPVLQLLLKSKGHVEKENQKESQKKKEVVDQLPVVLKAVITSETSVSDAQLRDAVENINSLRNVISIYTAPERQHSLSQVTRQNVAERAFTVIHLMNKYNRQQPEPPLVPRMKLWELETKPANTPLQKLQRCCETNIDWVNFVLDTARVLISCKRVPQVRELLELFEKRLLKMKQRPLPFRLWMLSYAKIRVKAGLSRIPTSPEGKKHLEWYLAAPVDDELTLVHLDQFHVCRYFVTAKCVDPTGIFAHTVNQNAPDPHDFFSIGPHVYCGSENEAEHRDALQFMVMTAQMFGVRLKRLKPMLESIEVLGFEFSRNGITLVTQT